MVEALSLPLHGMLELKDGSSQVVSDVWSWRALACLVAIRVVECKKAISADTGVPVEDVIVPPGYVLHNDGISDCHKALKATYLPAIKRGWEHKHGRPFVQKSKFWTDGCDIRGACPEIPLSSK